jgi:hypothetical protein
MYQEKSGNPDLNTFDGIPPTKQNFDADKNSIRHGDQMSFFNRTKHKPNAFFVKIIKEQLGKRSQKPGP